MRGEGTQASDNARHKESRRVFTEMYRRANSSVGCVNIGVLVTAYKAGHWKQFAYVSVVYTIRLGCTALLDRNPLIGEGQEAGLARRQKEGPSL